MWEGKVRWKNMTLEVKSLFEFIKNQGISNEEGCIKLGRGPPALLPMISIHIDRYSYKQFQLYESRGYEL